MLHCLERPCLAIILSAIFLASCGGGERVSAAAGQLVTPVSQVATPQRAQTQAGLDLPPTPTDADLLNWAETTYAAYFPGAQPTKSLPPYVYRYYPDTQNYLGLAGSSVYVMGPVSGGNLLHVGERGDFACGVYPRYCSALSIDFIPRLRGTGVAEHIGWTSPSDPRWQTVGTLVGSGANVVRIFLEQYSPDTGQPLLPGQTLDKRVGASLDTYGNLVEYLLANKIHVVLVLNTTFLYPAVHTWPDDGRTLFSSASAQQEVVDAWASLAERYKGRPGLVFDLLNEPRGTSDAELANDSAIAIARWSELSQRIIDRVSAIDSKRWMMVEPMWGDATYFSSLAVSPNNRAMYSFHFYAPHYFTHQGVAGLGPAGGTVGYPSVTQDYSWQSPQQWDKAALKTLMQVGKDFAVQHNVRVVIGEAGATLEAPPQDRVRWAQDVVAVADELSLDLIWFQWDGWNVPADFRYGWSWDSSLTSVLPPFFSKNMVPALR